MCKKGTNHLCFPGTAGQKRSETLCLLLIEFKDCGIPQGGLHHLTRAEAAADIHIKKDLRERAGFQNTKQRIAGFLRHLYHRAEIEERKSLVSDRSKRCRIGINVLIADPIRKRIGGNPLLIQRDNCRAGWVPIVNLYIFRPYAEVCNLLPCTDAERILSNLAVKEGILAELRQMTGQIKRCAADIRLPVDHIPEHLSE